MFNPMRPHLLYAAIRRTDAIYCWDIRGDGASPVEAFDQHLPPRQATETSKVLNEAVSSPRVSKAAATNQRRKFDIDISGSWLGTGDQVISQETPASVASPDVTLVGRGYPDF